MNLMAGTLIQLHDKRINVLGKYVGVLISLPAFSLGSQSPLHKNKRERLLDSVPQLIYPGLINVSQKDNKFCSNDKTTPRFEPTESNETFVVLRLVSGYSR